MKLIFKPLEKKDYKRAIYFAVEGMDFERYMENELLLNLYGGCFLYMELDRMTQTLVLYAEDGLASVLLAEVKGEEKKHRSLGQQIYARIFDFLRDIFARESKGAYETANEQMLAVYLKKHSPDGEIIFLATNPDLKTKGIGTKLLTGFEKREEGKEIFLFADSSCTYQFYERRGSERLKEKISKVKILDKETDLRCMLYRRIIQ